VPFFTHNWRLFGSVNGGLWPWLPR